MSSISLAKFLAIFSSNIDSPPLSPSFWDSIYFFFLKLIYFIFGCAGSLLLGFSLVVVSGSYSSLCCAGFSLQWLLLLQSMGSRLAASVVVAHGLSYSMACGIFLDQGSNPCPLHWQVDS